MCMYIHSFTQERNRIATYTYMGHEVFFSRSKVRSSVCLVRKKDWFGSNRLLF